MRLHQATASAWQRNHQPTIDSEKATYGMGGNICKSYAWFATIYNIVRVNLQNIQGILTVQQQRKKKTLITPIRTQTDVSPKKIYKCPKSA